MFLAAIDFARYATTRKDYVSRLITQDSLTISTSAFGVQETQGGSISTMPGERRNLRSNKDSSSSSTNGEKARSNSTSSGTSKDKPVPTRSTSSKNKTLPTKKPSTKESTGDKPLANGTEPIENGVNGSEDIDMIDEGPEKAKKGVNNKNEDEMTVVVPPPKASNIAGEHENGDERDVTMEGSEDTGAVTSEAVVDPKAKAITG